MDGSSRSSIRFSASDADPVLRALADGTRRQTLQLLLTDEFSVTELVEILRLPQSSVSRHLKVLREADLVADRRDGVTSLYQARPSTGEAGDLPHVLIGWLRQQPLPRTIEDRRAKVLRARESASGSFFERIGKRWDELRSAAFGEAFAGEALAALLPADWTIADIGTGTGFLLPVLADNAKRVIAVEPAASMLACARQRALDQGLRNVEFHQGDLDRLPIPDETCHVAIACLVLHHVASPEAAIREIHRILKPAGRMLIVEQRPHENQSFYEMMQDRWWGLDAEDLARQAAGIGFGRIRHHPLRWTDGRSAKLESPGLFVLTGERATK